MIAYLDSSVLLRLVLRQPGALKEWSSVEEGVTSALTQVECLRTLDRLRVVERIPDEALASRREAILGFSPHWRLLMLQAQSWIEQRSLCRPHSEPWTLFISLPRSFGASEPGPI